MCRIVNFLIFQLRSIKILVQGSVAVFLDEPWSFGSKVTRRLQTYCPGVLRHYFEKLVARLLFRKDIRPNEEAERLLARRVYRGSGRIPASKRGREPNSKPSIVYFATNSIPFTHSGYTERTHQLMKALVRKGLEISVMTRLAYPLVVGRVPLYEERVIDGVPYRVAIPSHFPSSTVERERMMVEELVEYARSRNATMIHTTSDFRNAIVVSQAADRLGIPWIYEVRGEPENSWLSRFPEEYRSLGLNSDFYKTSRVLELKAMQSADKVITISEVAKEALIERGVDENKIFVIPNGIDAALIGARYSTSEIRSLLNLQDRFTIGTITSLVNYEGISTLVEAMRHLPTMQCLIVGDGEEMSRLREQVRRSGLVDRVIFTGRVPSEEVWRYYAALDVFVVPRIDSAVTRHVTPIKPLKALALGVSLAASDLPALREVTGGFACYFPPGDSRALAETVKGLVDTSISTEQALDIDTFLRGRTWDSNAQKLINYYSGQRDL